MNGLGESSILASRTRDFQAQPQSREQREVSEEAEASPRLQVAIALLRFVELISRFKIGVSSELEPVRHAPTIGEGLSFTVKEHIRGEPKRKVLKISKQNLSAGQTGPFDPRRFDALMREAYILLSDPILEHENILKMTAVTWAVMGHDPLHIYPALILERSPYGDLIHFQASRNDVTWNMRKTLCYDVAAGLEALHDCGIVHGDLKAKNILVFDHPTRRFSAKICDFGSAVILPTTSDSGPKIKLPAFTPPWNAPESRDAVPASRLHLTDVWSLGLLMWQILVHGDPFACLDLPLDPTIRLAMINKFLALPDNAGHIAALVERQVDFIGYHEVKLLIGIFGATLEWKPEDRDLVRVLELLFPHNGRSSSEPASPDKNRSTGTAAPGITKGGVRPASNQSLKLKLMVKKVDFDLIWIQRLHFLVQTEIRLALEEFCGYGVVRAGGQFNPANVLRTTMHIHQSAVWMIFQCHLLGVGTRANPGLALDILFTSGIKENGGYWKSWVLTGLLYAALEIPVPRDRIVQIGAGGLLSSYASLFYAKMTDTELMNNKPSADSHGIDCSKDELADVWSTWTNSGETSGRVRDRPALNSTFIRDRRTGGGNTMLHAAALYDLTDLARFLTRQEEPLVDINAVNDSHETALIIACRWNSYDIIHLLLDNGADASITDERGENGLYWLSSLPEQSAEHTARRLVEHGAKLHVCSDEAWESTDLFPDSYFYDCRTKAGPSGPLVRAVANRDMYSLRVLLKLYNERSEEIGSENKWAGVFTAFHPALRIAAELHLYQIAELICKEMHDALQGLLPPPVPRSIVGYMIVKFIKSSAVIRGVLRMTHHVHRLCLHGKHWRAASSRTLELLHEYGIVGSQVFANGSWIRTLNFAIACGNHEAVVTLLDLPEFLAAIDEVDEVFHIPPLHQALNSQQLDILRLLIVKGATVDLRKGREPEHNLTAVEASYLHVVASLRIDDLSFANTILEHGVPADIADNRGCTAFSLAVNRGAFGLARLLIENGVDLRTPGYLGVTPLGEAMFGSNVRQCDDWIATVKFLLEFDHPPGSLFVVDPKFTRTILHAAASHYTADKDYPTVLNILIKHFNDPHQINARATTEACSTPLQSAIACGNALAVAALTKAGADIDIKDPYGRDTMDLARHTVRKLLGGIDPNTLPADKFMIEGGLECISILADHGSWPEMSQLGNRICNALQEVKPLLDMAMTLTHQECYVLGLETKILQIIASHIGDKPAESGGTEKQLDGMEEQRRQIDTILQPLFYAELCVGISMDLEPDTGPKSFPVVRENIPWCKTLNNARLGEFQQSAAFEYMLDHVGRLETSHGLSRYARSANPEHLPYDYRYLRWPMPLLDWYVRAIKKNHMQLTTEEQGEVVGFIHILRTRESMRRNGQFPLAPFGEKFCRFHFDLLQPQKLDFEGSYVVIATHYRCRCFRQDVGRVNIAVLEKRAPHQQDLVRIYAEENRSLSETLQREKISEALRRRQDFLWKDRAGIDDEECPGWLTGLWKRQPLARGSDANTVEASTEKAVMELTLED